MEELVHKYQYSFKLMGNPESSHNLLRLATFVSTRNPATYELYQLDEERTLVFWNPHA